MIKDQKAKGGIKGVYLLDGVIDGAQLAVSKLPNKFRRFLVKVFFGWGFATIEQLTTKK